MQSSSRSDLHTRQESEEKERGDSLLQPEVDEAQSLPDSGISLTEKSQLYDEYPDVQVGFNLPEDRLRDFKQCSVGGYSKDCFNNLWFIDLKHNTSFKFF